jgi:hypothetical protein
VDEVYDTGPRELETKERFTLRILPTAPSFTSTSTSTSTTVGTGAGASDNSEIESERQAQAQALAKLVAAYAICPSVAEVQLLWHESYGASPDPTLFSYTKTHCPVHVDLIPSSSLISYGSTLPTSTAGVMLLDQAVEVSCRDLKLAHSVWR